MINLRVDEDIVKAFEIKKCTYGRGVFYVTNNGVYLETQKNGLVLDLPFEVLKTYKYTSNDTFRIEWEEGLRRFHYEFKVQDTARQVFDVYSIANENFAKSMSEIEALKMRFSKA